MQFRAKLGVKLRRGPALHSAKNWMKPTMSLTPELAEETWSVSVTLMERYKIKQGARASEKTALRYPGT